MRTNPVARYARWAAAAAILLAASVAGVFAYRSWQARQVRKHAPAVVPPTVQQRSAEFSFSKVEQERTVFTVRASRATEFKEGKKNLLEDVWITIYGRTGQRLDNIHTRACDYLPDTGRIVCAGDVQMDLESAEQARERPGQRVIHVGTRNVSFDGDSGEARTDQEVVFHFPDGQGRGVGLTYNSRDAVVRLHREVALTLTPHSVSESGSREKAAEPVRPAAPLTLTASGLEYRRDDRTFRLLAPVRALQSEPSGQARQGRRELTAGELTLELDADLHARRLVARHQPQLQAAGPRGRALLAAHEFVAIFHRGGWAERILATGGARASISGPSGEEHLAAERMEFEMIPQQNEPHQLSARGDVKAQSNHGGASSRLETSALRLFFAPRGKQGERLVNRAETLAPATLEWDGTTSVGGKTTRVTTRVRGQQMAAEFGERNRLKQLTGRDGVELERRLANRSPQLTTSRELVAKFGPAGELTEMEQADNVRFREADRTAQAEHARQVSANDTVMLTGSVILTDPSSRTTAQSMAFDQRTGEIQAEGEVRTNYVSAGRGAITNLAPQPAHISAERLLANPLNGRAVYSGGARLWQGDAVVEADSIELLREARQLNARGNVRAVFPQGTESSHGPPGGSPGKLAATKRGASAESDVWRLRAGTLTYWSGGARARLEQNVTAESRQGLISGRELELFFSSSPGGPQQLTRALASGGVTVRQGERRGTAAVAEYTAADGKFVLSGGHPTLHDASRGTTSGRQLTFFFADDRIVVDSEEGLRTITRHRVEK